MLDSGNDAIYTLRTAAQGPQGHLPFTDGQLLTQPSGHLFGWTQNAGMGWPVERIGGREFVILSTQGRGCPDVDGGRGDTLRRFLQRSLRWPDPGDRWHDGFLGIPQ